MKLCHLGIMPMICGRSYPLTVPLDTAEGSGVSVIVAVQFAAAQNETSRTSIYSHLDA